MALDLKVLFVPQFIPNASGVLFTMPAAPTDAVMKNGQVRLTNSSAAPVTVTLNADAAGTATGTVNEFFSAQTIAAHASIDLQLPTMGAGWTLRGVCSAANAVNIVETGGTIQYPSA